MQPRNAPRPAKAGVLAARAPAPLPLPLLC